MKIPILQFVQQDVVMFLVRFIVTSERSLYHSVYVAIDKPHSSKGAKGLYRWPHLDSLSNNHRILTRASLVRQLS